MPGLDGLFGSDGAIKQLFLWNLVGQVISSEFGPLFTAQLQDVQQSHPLVALPADVIADAVVRGLVSEDTGRAEAAKNGVDAGRFDTLLRRAKVRVQPGDLAQAVLRSYLTEADALAQARPQGLTAADFKILTDLAGDAPGPDQLAIALRRGLIDPTGRGPGSTSYDQGIAETRLHNKWGPVVRRLAEVLLSPVQAADAHDRGFISEADAAKIAHDGGLSAESFAVLRQLVKVRLSPPDAASAVIRNFLPAGEAEATARAQGVDAATFTTMTHLAGDAPGPQQLAEALRRGAIPAEGAGPDSISFQQGIAEGRLANKWAPVIEALAKLWPTPVDALDAALKGQVTAEEGRKLYERLGGDLQFYPWLLSSQGAGPTPLEATVMANRGFIPWDGVGPEVTSFAQAVHESRYRDKWATAYKDFAKYLPDPSTVGAFLAHGVIDEKRAAALWAQHGMSEQVIAEYAAEAQTEALSAYRGLTVTTVLDAYHEGIIAASDATSILGALHVTPPAAALLLAYVDARRAFAQVTAAVTRVRALFAARKITVGTARGALNALNVPSAQVDPILAAWEVENSITVRPLTQAQIADAFELKIMTEADAMTELENLGYTPYDAWVILSLKVKAPLPSPPAGGPAPPQAQVIPGTT